MNQPTLQLQRYFFAKVAIEAQPDGRDNPGKVDTELEVARSKDNPDEFMVVLTVKLVNAEEKHAPYCGEVVVIGYFQLQPGNPKPEASVAKAGAAMLYGAAREMITNITARGPWPAIQIQIVDFYKQTADQPGPVAADGR